MAKATFPACPELLAINFTTWPHALAFDHKGQRILASAFDTPLAFDAASGAALGTLTKSTMPDDRGVCWTIVADSPKHLLAAIHAAIGVWDASGKKALRHFESPLGIVMSLALAPDQKTLVYGTAMKLLVCVDFATGSIRWQVPGKTSFSNRVAITPDGRHCVTGGNDKTVRLFDLRSGSEIHTVGTHTGYVQGLAVLPDGKRAVTGGRDKTVRIWDLHAAKLLATLEGHRKEIRALQVTSDGKFAVSAGGDGARVWDLKSGSQIAAFDGHGKSVSCLSIAPDDKTVATGGEDGHLRIWQLPK